MPSHASRPKILGFISEEARAWLVASVVLVSGCSLTGVAAWVAVEQYQQRMRQRFQLLVNERYTRLEERFEDQEQRLDSLRRFFVNSSAVSREEFNGFAGPLLHRTQAYAWLPRVSREQREGFEQSVRAQLGGEFFIRDLNAAGEWVPSAVRDEYAPVLYSQTQSILGSPLGFDVSSRPDRRSTLEQARDLGQMVVSPPTMLVGVEPDYALGVLLVAPVSRRAEGASTTLVVYGYVTAVISLRQLVVDGFPGISRDNLVMEIVGTHPAGRTKVLYHSNNAAADLPLSASRGLTLGNQVFQVNIFPSEAFLQSSRSSVTAQVVMGGLLSLLLSTLLYILLNQRRRALSLVQERTAQLREREQQLRNAHGQLRSVLNAATQVAIIATDLRGVISTFNAGAEYMLGYATQEVLGSLTLDKLHLPEQLQARADELSREHGKPIAVPQAMLVQEAEHRKAREWTLVRKDGSQLVVNMLSTPLLDEDGLWVGSLAICVDITEQKRIEEELRTLSTTDTLTGIGNRRYFEVSLKNEMARVRRTEGALAVIMLDIDHFKRINDQYGHAVGDAVLQEVCRRIRQRLRRTDVFCRTGGEEFVVLCPGTTAQQAHGLALELWETLRDSPFEAVWRVTASFGIAGWHTGETADALLLRADSGVYAAKQAGRDQVADINYARSE